MKPSVEVVAARPTARELDDRALVGAATAGDDAAWREIVRRHSAALREAVRETGRISEADVDDVVSDFWLSLIENDKRQLRRFVPSRGAELLSWLTVRLLQVADRHALSNAEVPETIPLEDVKYLVSDPPSATLRARSSPTMMKVEEVAERWDLNVKTVYAMINRGELHSRRCGRVVRIPRHVVESFEKQASVAPERMPRACR